MSRAGFPSQAGEPPIDPQMATHGSCTMYRTNQRSKEGYVEGGKNGDRRHAGGGVKPSSGERNQ